MNPLLTTLTPYWNRPKMLDVWLEAIKGASHPEVVHCLMFIGEMPSRRMKKRLEAMGNVNVLVSGDTPEVRSIGHYHNLMAGQTGTEWMMKLDVDCMPNVLYWEALLPLLKKAGEREWFNGGMLYVNEAASQKFLNREKMPLDVGTYEHIMFNREKYSGFANALPAATNFICRTEDYLKLGGCHSGFQGAFWQDYQQIYMLEHYRLGRCPLPDALTLRDVTERCRDMISRPKALELWRRDEWLCLLHKWHPANRSHVLRRSKEENRRLLFEYIDRKRRGMG